MKFLITGHTGFKGAWLVTMLSVLGHSVSGIALDPEEGSLFDISNADRLLENDLRGDIRDISFVKSSIELVQPEVIIHLAAQPIVRVSYDKPQLTMETNVMGTMNVLTASSAAESLRAVLVVTTDKVYRNVGKRGGYTEDDPLGGVDPYSASKAMADILCQSWGAGLSDVPILILRAGNVIGGGDRAIDRIVPDLIKGFSTGRPVVLRHPQSIRPWQHVLDCLNGYLLALDAVLRGMPGSIWNIGPDDQSPVTVSQIAEMSREIWGFGSVVVDSSKSEGKIESDYLTLNSSKARTELGWFDHLLFPESLIWTITWEREVHRGVNPSDITSKQTKDFLEREPRLWSLRS